MAVAWQDWNDELLERARETGRSVLLVLDCSWGQPSRSADDPDLALSTSGRFDRHEAWVAEHCLAARVDVADFPDLEARYGCGLWPTLVVLNAAGEVLMPEQLPQAETPTGSASTPWTATEPSAIPGLIERALLADFDERHGGFGGGQKFPHPEALDYAVARHAEHRSARLHEILEKTCAHMAAGALWDAVDGGFFRYCAGRDWSRPYTEKLLETQVGLAGVYLDAGQLLGRRDFLRIGEQTLQSLRRDLADERTGLFHSGIDPDDEYYGLGPAERRTRRRPAVSGRLLADGNAQAVCCLLKAGAVLGSREETQAGVALMEKLLRTLWRPGKGMHHYDDGHGPQLNIYLRDQAETVLALLHVLQATDDRRFLWPLEQLVELMAGRFLNPDGRFMSRSDGRVRVGRQDSQIVDGALAAEALMRAALSLGRPGLAELAARALQQHAGDCRRYGYAMAAYGRSMELCLHPPLHVLVVGRRGERHSEALLRHVSASDLPRRVVQFLDPVTDAHLLERLRIPRLEHAAVYVLGAGFRGGGCAEPSAITALLGVAQERRLGITSTSAEDALSV